MKKVSLFGISLLSILAISTVVFFQSCEDDPCKDVVCLNGGVCDGGACACTQGYEGTDCGTESRAKFLGTYTADDNCSSSGTATYVTTIVEGTEVYQVRLTNFWDAFVNAVVATVDGNTISIATQEPDSDGFTVSGSGTISGNTITWNYTITDTSTGDQDNCSSTWTK